MEWRSNALNRFNGKPIRVLQIIGIVCGGGVEAVIMNYYRNIDRNQVQFDFVIDGYDKTYLDDEIKAMGGKVYHVEPYRKNIFLYMVQIYKIVRNGHYDIVHSNMNTLSVFSLFPAWLAGAKQRILHNHSTAVKQEGKRSLMKHILRPIAPLFANHYAACSIIAGNWMYGKARMAQGEVKIIRNAIDLKKYAFSPDLRKIYRQEFGFSDDDLVIGHVGRFVFPKNHRFLLQVFNEINKRTEKAKLLLIGDGELRKEIEEKVHEYGFDKKVCFLGLREDVQAIYNAMDVFVLPSWYEGLPVVSVEAQANGLSCVVSSNVSKECVLTSRVYIKDLASGYSEWAKCILSNNKSGRNKFAVKELKKNNYDIKNESIKLTNMYMNLMKGKNNDIV